MEAAIEITARRANRWPTDGNNNNNNKKNKKNKNKKKMKKKKKNKNKNKNKKKNGSSHRNNSKTCKAKPVLTVKRGVGRVEPSKLTVEPSTKTSTCSTSP